VVESETSTHISIAILFRYHDSSIESQKNELKEATSIPLEFFTSYCTYKRAMLGSLS